MIPNLSNISITIAPQLINGASLIVSALAAWSGINGIVSIAQGASMFSGAKGRPQKREEAMETCKDGAWGIAIGAGLLGIVGTVRAALGV